jgi:hypothetical protein
MAEKKYPQLPLLRAQHKYMTDEQIIRIIINKNITPTNIPIPPPKALPKTADTLKQFNQIPKFNIPQRKIENSIENMSIREKIDFDKKMEKQKNMSEVVATLQKLAVPDSKKPATVVI